MRYLLIAAMMAVLTACATGATPQSRMPFPEGEYLALPKAGNATVRGRAFLEAEGGVIVTAAGTEVILNPVTSYSLEWYQKAYVPGIAMAEADPRLSKYILTQILDADGRFTFRNVPPGDYFVTTKITLVSPSTGERRGGTMTKRITVKDREEIEVIITQ